MGARGWVEEVAWNGSVEGCLEVAQARVLASDEIFAIVGSRSEMEANVEALREFGIPELTESAEAALDRLDEVGRPASAADARHLLGLVDHGTGTILDVDGIRPEPRPLGDEPPWRYEGLFLSPLPDEMLVERYGSAHPAPEAVDGELSGDITINDGRYVVTYEDDRPVGVVFYGWSSW